MLSCRLGSGKPGGSCGVCVSFLTPCSCYIRTCTQPSRLDPKPKPYAHSLQHLTVEMLYRVHIGFRFSLNLESDVVCKLQQAAA